MRDEFAATANTRIELVPGCQLTCDSALFGTNISGGCVSATCGRENINAVSSSMTKAEILSVAEL